MSAAIRRKNFIMLCQFGGNHIPIVMINRRAVYQHDGRTIWFVIPKNFKINFSVVDCYGCHIAYINTNRYNHSMTNILDDYKKTIDPRTALFDVKIDSETDEMLTLSGGVLDQSQLNELPRLFPTGKLDTASIRILNAETHERVYVA